MNILITGEVGIGKTTILNDLKSELKPLPVRSLVVEQMLKGGKRVGFSAVIESGRSKAQILIAHKTELKSKVFVGSFHVDVLGIERSMRLLSNRNENTLILDEIGRMQSKSEFFIQEANKLLATPDLFVVATIVLDDEKFARQFKLDKSNIILTANKFNRGGVANFITDLRINQFQNYKTLIKNQKEKFNREVELRFSKLSTGV